MYHIVDAAQEVLDKYGGRDVFETAENSGANVWFRKLGGLKGFYICENGERYIVINEGLDDVMKKVVCAHEFGHDTLHRELSGGGIREGTLFLDTNKTEREANFFAACILISDEEFLDAAAQSADVSQVASLLGLPREIIKYKLQIMNGKGYDFKADDIKNDFLK